MTQRRTLPTGDYSIVGYENKTCIERKSLEDLYQTLGKGRERFIRELERMQTMDYSAVVIESSWINISNPTNNNPFFHSKMHPNAIIGTIVSCADRFPKTDWKAVGNRQNAETVTFQLLFNYWTNGTDTKTKQDIADDAGEQEAGFGLAEHSGGI